MVPHRSRVRVRLRFILSLGPTYLPLPRAVQYARSRSRGSTAHPLQKLRPLIVPMYAQRPEWQAWRGLCFRMSGPRDWDAAKRARLKCHWGGGEGSEQSRKLKLARHCANTSLVSSRRPHLSASFRRRLSTRKSLPQRQDSRQFRAQQRTRYFPTDSLTRAPSLSPHLTSCILRPPQQQDTRGTTHGRVLPAPFPWARQTCSTGAVYKSSLTLLRRQPDLQVQAERQAS